MKKSFLILVAAALIIPAFAFAAPGFNYPGHNSGFNHPSNGGGVAVHPGHNNSNNNHGYNNNYGHGNNNYNNHGNSNNHGYGNNHGNYNNHGYNNGYGHGNNNGNYNNHGNNNGYGHGNNHGNNNNHGHYSPANARIRMAHRAIKRAFQDAENSYYPFLMSHKDKRRMAMALRTISAEIGSLMRMVGPRFRDNLREVGTIIERARFTLVSENDASAAHKKVQRAERKYNRIADILVR